MIYAGLVSLVTSYTREYEINPPQQTAIFGPSRQCTKSKPHFSNPYFAVHQLTEQYKNINKTDPGNPGFYIQNVNDR